MRKQRLTILAFLLSCMILQTRAQSLDWRAVHETTLRGIDHLYNLEPDAATLAFDSVKQMAPDDPRGFFFGSMVRFWLYTMSRKESDYAQYLSESDRVVEICETLLDRNPGDAKALFYLGGTRGYRGMAHQLNGSVLKAVQEGRQGFIDLEDAVRADSALFDARMGFGLFKYLLAKLPRSFSWILDILGYGGDIEQGLTLLKQAAAHGTYTRSESSFFLSQFLFNEHRYDEAFGYLNPLLKRYPENTVFLVLASNWYLRLDSLNEALSFAELALRVNEKKAIRYGEEFIYSTLGNVHFSRNEFVQAKVSFASYLRKAANQEKITNRALYRAGLSFEISGNRAEAVEIYRRLQAENEWNSAYMSHLYKRAQQLLRHPLTGAEIDLIKGENDQDRRRYDSAAAWYSVALLRCGDDQDLRARILYRIQSLQFDRGQFAEALQTAQEISLLKPTIDLWVLPHALYLQGATYERLGKTTEAVESFDRAKDFDDYDFQESLERRLEAGLKRLKG